MGMADILTIHVQCTEKYIMYTHGQPHAICRYATPGNSVYLLTNIDR